MEKIKTEYSFKYIVFMWSLLLFGYFINYFHSLSTGILQPYLMDEFNIDSVTITNIGSMYFYAYFFMQIPTGILSTKYGVKKTVAGSLFFALFGTICFAMAQNVAMLFIGRLFIGIGCSTIFVCILTFQAEWMKVNIITTMTGIGIFLGTLGGIFAQSPLVWLVESFGWRGSMYIIAFATFINLILLIKFMVEKKSINSEIPKEVEEENETEINNKKTISKGLLAILLDLRTWAPILFFIGVYGSYIVISGYAGSSWLMNYYGYSAIEASFYVSLCVLGTAFGPIFIGAFSDKTHSRKLPIIVFGGLYIICWAVICFFPDLFNALGIAVLLFTLGFLSTAFVVTWACIQEINAKEYSAIAASIVNMGGYAGPIIMPYLFVLSQNSFENTLSPEAFIASFKVILYAVIFCYFVGLLTVEPLKAKKKT